MRMHSRMARHTSPHVSLLVVVVALFGAAHAGVRSGHGLPGITRVAARSARASPRLASSSDDEFLSCISADGSISAKAVLATDLVRTVTSRQGCLPLASAALGRALMCSMLCADGMKGEESMQLRFNGDGPLRGVLAICDGELRAKGYVGNPKVNIAPKPNGKIDVGAGVGSGQLYVVRTKQLPGEEYPSVYNSITELQSGEVAEDVNFWLADSEQKQGALAAGVFVGGEGVEGANDGSCVTAAAGWHVHLLPFADAGAVEQLEKNLAAIADLSPTKMVQQGWKPRDMLNALLDGMDPEFFDSRVPQLADCCSDERAWRTLALLPKDEVRQILDDNEKVEIRCEFCTTKRVIEPDAIRERLEL
mmetsp:Transcript_10443/g.25134  ORF Transcript_10443/g.25134 Transcript_10443/m.25134 type:complete len:363 (-) Transcript_10443:322-1410(-)